MKNITKKVKIYYFESLWIWLSEKRLGRRTPAAVAEFNGSKIILLTTNMNEKDTLLALQAKVII